MCHEITGPHGQVSLCVSYIISLSVFFVTVLGFLIANTHCTVDRSLGLLSDVMVMSSDTCKQTHHITTWYRKLLCLNASELLKSSGRHFGP